MSRKTNTCPTCGDDSSDSKQTSGYCRKCCSLLSIKYQKIVDNSRPFYRKVIRKKTECKKKGIEFNLSEEYLASLWTGVCPILGVPLDIYAKKQDPYAPHLDRIDPNLGYVMGNVQWLSGRANRLKNNITQNELERLYKWLTK